MRRYFCTGAPDVTVINTDIENHPVRIKFLTEIAQKNAKSASSQRGTTEKNLSRNGDVGEKTFNSGAEILNPDQTIVRNDLAVV